MKISCGFLLSSVYVNDNVCGMACVFPGACMQFRQPWVLILTFHFVWYKVFIILLLLLPGHLTHRLPGILLALFPFSYKEYWYLRWVLPHHAFMNPDDRNVCPHACKTNLLNNGCLSSFHKIGKALHEFKSAYSSETYLHIQG